MKRLRISREELEERFRKLQTLAQIAKEFNVSIDTVYRRATDFGLTKQWHKSHGLRIWAGSSKTVFVIQVDPEKSEQIRNEMLKLSLNPDLIVQTYEPHETWREVRSEMAGTLNYQTQKQRFEELQKISVAESGQAWDER